MTGNFSRTAVVLICVITMLSACGRKPARPGAQHADDSEVVETVAVEEESTPPMMPDTRAPEKELLVEEPPSPETLGIDQESDQAMLEEPLPSPEPSPTGPPKDGTAADFKQYEAWFTRNNLDLNREGMLDEDPDSDGYSNREEFLADTDPNDQTSHPGYHPIMRLRELKVVEAPLRLEDIEGSTAKVLNTETGEVTTVATGDSIPGTSMKAGKIVRRIETDKFGMQADLSSLTLVDQSTGKEMVLVPDMPTRTAETSAELTSSTDPSVSVTVRQGEEFQWPGEPERSYMVIDLRPTQVVVRETDTGNTWTIPLQK